MALTLRETTLLNSLFAGWLSLLERLHYHITLRRDMALTPRETTLLNSPFAGWLSLHERLHVSTHPSQGGSHLTEDFTFQLTLRRVALTSRETTLAHHPSQDGSHSTRDYTSQLTLRRVALTSRETSLLNSPFRSYLIYMITHWTGQRSVWSKTRIILPALSFFLFSSLSLFCHYLILLVAINDIRKGSPYRPSSSLNILQINPSNLIELSI